MYLFEVMHQTNRHSLAQNFTSLVKNIEKYDRGVTYCGLRDLYLSTYTHIEIDKSFTFGAVYSAMF